MKLNTQDRLFVLFVCLFVRILHIVARKECLMPKKACTMHPEEDASIKLLKQVWKMQFDGALSIAASKARVYRHT